MDERLLAALGGILGGTVVVLYLWHLEWRRALAGQRPQY